MVHITTTLDTTLRVPITTRSLPLDLFVGKRSREVVVTDLYVLVVGYLVREVTSANVIPDTKIYLA